MKPAISGKSEADLADNCEENQFLFQFRKQRSSINTLKCCWFSGKIIIDCILIFTLKIWDETNNLRTRATNVFTFCTVWIHCFWITQHTSEKHIMNCIKSMRQYLWKYRQRYSKKYGADTVRLFALWVITEGLDVLLRPSFSRYADIRDWLCRSSLRPHMGNPAGIWIGERERENRFHLQDYWSHWDAACMKHKVSFSSPLQRQENENVWLLGSYFHAVEQ